ncbi:MAG: hypothetical protein NC393_07165 [Clostridium sp.]|nr:hypothetical protein [Clostridium sp.]MCM1171891.1 hypothetical protein [Clostridium sp.]MCM1209783.1 hypothetical protein [Ruminococcus sp.]
MIKYSIKNYIKNIWYNILVFMQLTITLFAFFFTMYTFQSKYRFFGAISGDMKGKGLLVSAISLESGDYLLSDSGMVVDSYNLSEVSGVKAMYQPLAGIEGVASHVRVYDRPLIDAFIPDIDNGHWLNKASDVPDDTIPVVISYNKEGYKTGDILELSDGTNSYKLEIVGVLAKNASVLCMPMEVTTTDDYKGLFWNYSSVYEEGILVLMDRQELIDKTQIPCILSGLLFLNYDEDISGEAMENNLTSLYRDGLISYTLDYGTIYENSKKLIVNDMVIFIPISVIVMLVTMVSTIKVIAINTDNIVYNLSIYYLNGCTWEACKKISVISNMLSLIMAVFTNIIVIMGLFCNDVIVYDKKLILYVMMVFTIFCIAYFIFCVLYQIFILRKYTPCEIIRGENND